MSNAFEDAMHQGYSAAEMAADAQEFIDTHGCMDCQLYGSTNCLSERCDNSYKGGRT